MNRGVMGVNKFVVGLMLLLLSGVMLPRQTVFAACGVPSGRGYATLNFDVATAGDYRVWSRIMPSSAQNDSYLLEIDGGQCATVGDSGSIPAGAWSWVDYQNGNGADKISATLTAGSHSMRVIGREDDVKVDVVLLVSDTSCVPTGVDGSPCTAGGSVSPTPTPNPSPSPTPTPGGSPSPSPNPTPGASPSPSSGGTGSTGGSTTKPNGSTGTATATAKKNTTTAKAAPVANKIQDVPKAALATFAHPLAISQTVKSKYGWASLLLSLAMLAGAGFAIWKFGWPLAKRYVLRRGTPSIPTSSYDYVPPVNEVMAQSNQVITPQGNDQNTTPPTV